MATSRNSQNLIFPNLSQTFFHRPGVFSLSPLSLSRGWLSRILERDHLLNHLTPSPHCLDLHSPTLPILRYHLFKHLFLLTMLHGWTYQPRLALLALSWRNLQWSMTNDFNLWGIWWTSIGLGSLFSLSISSRGLISLRSHGAKDYLHWGSHGTEDWSHGGSHGVSAWGDDGLLAFHVSTSTSSALIRWRPPHCSFFMLPNGEII